MWQVFNIYAKTYTRKRKWIWEIKMYHSYKNTILSIHDHCLWYLIGFQNNCISNHLNLITYVWSIMALHVAY